MISREEAMKIVKEALAKGWNVSGTRDVLYVETE
jgi:predicted small secreted protein